jgi:hypothetical protein
VLVVAAVETLVPVAAVVDTLVGQVEVIKVLGAEPVEMFLALEVPVPLH